MPSEKKEEVLPVFFCKSKAEGAEKKATHRFPHQHLVQGDQKLRLKNLLEDLESENTEPWQPAIVAGERLQEKINESVTCRFCQGSVELVENL